MPWIPTPHGGPGYTCTTPGCGYVTSGDPIDIARHRLEHLAKVLEGKPWTKDEAETFMTGAPLTPAVAIEQAEGILRADLERARKLWNPTIGGERNVR